MTSLDILCFNPLNLKNKIMKIQHKKIFRGPWKILKDISWSINICLKYFMGLTKTLEPPSYILNVRSLMNLRINTVIYDKIIKWLVLFLHCAWSFLVDENYFPRKFLPTITWKRYQVEWSYLKSSRMFHVTGSIKNKYVVMQTLLLMVVFRF